MLSECVYMSDYSMKCASTLSALSSFDR